MVNRQYQLFLPFHLARRTNLLVSLYYLNERVTVFMLKNIGLGERVNDADG